MVIDIPSLQTFMRAQGSARSQETKDRKGASAFMGLSTAGREQRHHQSKGLEKGVGKDQIRKSRGLVVTWWFIRAEWKFRGVVFRSWDLWATGCYKGFGGNGISKISVH